MVSQIRGRPLCAGYARAPILKLGAPVSFWGAVDPASGVIVDPRHPDCGRSVAGRILIVPGAVGSSSSSAVMLELLRARVAPAAIVLAGDDTILALGVIIARELGYSPIPVMQVSESDLETVPQDGTAVVNGETVSFD